MTPGIDIVPTPDRAVDEAGVRSVRDPQDWPIVRAARAAGVDVIVTGDKDLVDAGLDHPVIQTPAQFLATRP